MAGEPLYASPNGDGYGSSSDPVNLQNGLGWLSSGRTLILKDGVYTQDSITIPAGAIVQADSGVRPILTSSTNTPPSVTLGAGAKLSSVWMGGVKGASSGIVVANDGATLEICTFFGYNQCLTPYQNTTIKNNRFVNCGSGGLQHDIYVSYSGAPANIVIQEGIHVGGEGYKIHLYHNPEYVTIHANFMAGSSASDLAVQQGNDTITNNILWGPVAVSYWNANNSTFSKNIFGPTRANFTDVTQSAGMTVDGNVFCNGQTPFGTNPQVWDAAAITTNLGKSAAQIDAAISALETSFTGTVQQIHDDATIETYFATLKAVIDTWKVA